MAHFNPAVTISFLITRHITKTEQELQNIQSIDSSVFVAFDSRLDGILGISGNIRPGIKSTIKHLMQGGFDIIMLTGDTNAVAEKVGSALGIHWSVSHWKKSGIFSL